MKTLTFKGLIFAMGLSFLANQASAAQDLTPAFQNIYQQHAELSAQELEQLKKYEIYFIPGILAESFIDGDKRSVLALEKITKEYFGKQLEILNNKYKLSARRITTSSKHISQTRENIEAAVDYAKSLGKKVIFISHSLGGLALLEELVNNARLQDNIAGIAFLQSPFYGTPLGEVAMDPPYGLEHIIQPLMPYVNLSHETVNYVGIGSRTQFMNEYSTEIQKLTSKIPSFTVSGFMSNSKSAVKPLVDILKAGCFKALTDSCIGKRFFGGPYDENDGLIPLQSSFIPNTDYVVLKDVDHIEPILLSPFEDYKKEHKLTTILRLLLQK